MKKLIFFLVLLVTCHWTVITTVRAQTDIPWPMAGANSQRTSWAESTIPGAIKTSWVKPIEPYISQHVQVVGAENKVFVSTANGLYAFDAATGNQVWVYPTQLPLGHSPTYSNGVLYAGGMDRKIHAVSANTGLGLWTYSAEGGFSTNPVVEGGKIYAGNRDGSMYAINTNGTFAWKYQTGNQILQSAAFQDGVLYFGSNDGYAYALNALTGSLVWKSANKLPSMGFYSWWPVIYGNHVIFTRTPFEANLNGPEASWLFTAPSSTQVPGVLGHEPGNWVAGETTIDIKTNPYGNTFPNYFEQYPHRRNAIFLNRTNGQEAQFDLDQDGITDAAPISWVGDAGTRYPPIVSGFDNVLYFRTTNRASSGSFSGASISGWKVGTSIMSMPYSNMTGQSAFMPADEPMGISAAGNKIFWNLCCDRFVGGVDISKPNTTFPNYDGARQWRYISSPGLPFYSWPTNIGMPNFYFKEAVKYFWDPETGSDPPCCAALFWNENDKVGPAVYQDKMYVILGNALVAFAEGGAGSAATLLPSATTATATQAPLPLSETYLKSRLEQEVQEIVNAGHLKPSFSHVGLLSSWVRNSLDDYTTHYWHNPADIHLVLLRAMPYLSPNLQTAAKNYLKSEMANFSPALYNHIGWQSGTQRDPYVYPPTDASLFTLSFDKQAGTQFSGWGLPPHNVYALWKYVQAGLCISPCTPASLLSQITWFKAPITAIKPGLTDSYLASNPHVHNAYISGYKGYVELAKLAGQSSTQYGPYQSEHARLLSLRAQNLTAFPVPNAGSANLNEYYKSVRPIWNFMYLTPELADYLYTNAQSNVTSVVNKTEAIAPYWMVAINGEPQGENAFMPYQQTHSLFQAKAMILNQSQTELVKYLDSPIVPVGDLYYIDNLVAVLESSGAANLHCQPLGDANCDGNVNPTDLRLLIDQYFGSLFAFDFDDNGLVNSLDAAHIFKHLSP